MQSGEAGRWYPVIMDASHDNRAFYDAWMWVTLPSIVLANSVKSSFSMSNRLYVDDL